MKKNLYLIFAALVAIHLVLLMNLRFTAWPEMLSYPYLLNNGYKLYTDFVHPYPPLLTLVLAGLYKIFGYNLWALKIFTWSTIITGDVLIFLIMKKLTGKNFLSLAMLLFYIVIQPFLEGNQLWFDLAIVPFVLSGFLFLTNKKYFWAGVGFGLAVFIKQTTGIYLIFGLLYLVFAKEKPKNILSFIIGPAVFGACLAIYLIINNSLVDFLDWNLVYPFTFWTKFPGYVQMYISPRSMVILFLLLSPVVLFFKKIPFVIMTFLILSLVLVYPRFSFFHFQASLAFLVICYSLFFQQTKRDLIIIGIYGLVALGLVSRGAVWNTEARFWGREEIEFAKVIKQKADNSKSIFLLGSSSSLYVLSGTVSPKPWADNFGWYWEVPGFEDKTIKSWKQNMPSSVVWQESQAGNWFDLGVYQPKKLSGWIMANYNMKEEIEPGVWLWQKK